MGKMKNKIEHVRKMTCLFSVCLTLFFFNSCNESPTDFAFNWSTDIKNKILDDIKSPVDSVSIDSSRQNFREILLYSKGIKTKRYKIKLSTGDTLFSVFYSKDQNFEIVRELCPGVERNFEGIIYKGKHLGLAEFTYCDGKLKKQGYRYDGDVGVWREWDEQGKLTKEYNYGNADKLKNLKTIKYYY